MTPDEPFWEFSLRVYGTGGVPAACLALQDHYGADVNLLLYCCWLGAGEAELRPDGLARALDFTTPWADHVVRPLRRVRAWMKADAGGRRAIPTADYEALRESVKSAELEAERLQQSALESLAAAGQVSRRGSGAPRVMAANLGRYLAGSGIAVGPAVLDHLGVLVEAASGAPPADVQLALRGIVTDPTRD